MHVLLYVELAIDGALVGTVYALVALGIVLVYKASRHANLAQGAFAMTGGYVCLLIAKSLGLPIWAAAVASLGVLFLLGTMVERFVLRRMIGQPVVMVITPTLGLDILLRGLVPGLLGSPVKQLDLGIPAGADPARRRPRQPRLPGRRRRRPPPHPRRHRLLQLDARRANARRLRRPDRRLVGRHPGREDDRCAWGPCE